MEYSFLLLQNILLYTQDNHYISILFFFLFLLFYSIFSFPGILIFSSISGYLFGIYYGFIISILSVSFGSLAFFFLSKIFFKYFFIEYYKKYSQNINKYISHSTVEYLIIFRLVPGLPLIVQNTILSLLNISIFKFLLATFIGFSPIFFLSVFVGNKIKDIHLIKGISSQDLFSWDFIFFICFLIMLLILRIIFRKKN